MPTCEDENFEGPSTTADQLDEEIESDKEIAKISITDMKYAVSVLRTAFIQEDPSGLFDLHPIMDRISEIATKKCHQSKITTFFGKH